MNSSSEEENVTGREMSPEEISNQLLFIIEGMVLGSVACLGIAGHILLHVASPKDTVLISTYSNYRCCLIFFRCDSISTV